MAEIEGLSPRANEIYDFIRRKIQDRGYGPTVREIGAEFGIRSPKGVMCHLNVLQKKGLIHREPNMSRALEPLEGSRESRERVPSPPGAGDLLRQHLDARDFAELGIEPAVQLECSDCGWHGEATAATLYGLIELLRSRAERDYTCESCTPGRYFSWRPQARRPVLRKLPYADYLLSDDWRRKRDRLIEAAGHRCQLCNAPSSEVNLNVHHRTYERLGHEADGDLIVLCEECHDRHHHDPEDD